MSAAEQLVLGSQMRTAREAVYLTPDAVSRYLHIEADDLLNWEAGYAEPSLEELEGLAALYGRGLDYFLSPTPPPLRPERLRSKTPREVLDLPLEARKVLAQFDELCRTAVEIETLLGARPRAKFRPLAGVGDPVSLAHEQRRALGVSDGPIVGLRQRLEDLNIRIFELPVPNNEFSGFFAWHVQYGPCILVNARDVVGRRNFTLAHEFAHLLMGHTDGICQLEHHEAPTGAEERTADLFAVEFLMPARAFEAYCLARRVDRCPAVQDLWRIANAWHVSLEAATRRLVDLKFADRQVLSDMLAGRDQLKPFFRASGRPKWQRRLGERYVSLALRAYSKDKISLSKLAACLGVDVRNALKAAHSG